MHVSSHQFLNDSLLWITLSHLVAVPPSCASVNFPSPYTSSRQGPPSLQRFRCGPFPHQPLCAKCPMPRTHQTSTSNVKSPATEVFSSMCMFTASTCKSRRDGFPTRRFLNGDGHDRPKEFAAAAFRRHDSSSFHTSLFNIHFTVLVLGTTNFLI